MTWQETVKNLEVRGKRNEKMWWKKRNTEREREREETVLTSNDHKFIISVHVMDSRCKEALLLYSASTCVRFISPTTLSHAMHTPATCTSPYIATNASHAHLLPPMHPIHTYCTSGMATPNRGTQTVPQQLQALSGTFSTPLLYHMVMVQHGYCTAWLPYCMALKYFAKDVCSRNVSHWVLQTVCVPPCM